MNNDVTKPDSGALPPMSSGDNELTQTMLQTGMMLPPVQPGPIGAIGRFNAIRLLGAGGMGQVMLADEPTTGSRVAIKMIRPEFVKEQWAVRRFLTEAGHMYKMSHPNILRVLEVSDRKEGPYYVMPHVEGGSLARRIRSGEPLPREEIISIAKQIASALSYAHGRGIIHRDLKPANVLLERDGRAYLTDFGLLRTVFNDSMIDVSKPSVEGTAPYLSPSEAAGKAEDTRCDIYAFGALLYELLTGRKPFDGPNPTVIINKVLAGPPDPIRKLNPQAPDDLVRIAEWAMARELRDRYAEMGDVVRDLERAERGEEPIGPHGSVRAVGRPMMKHVLRAALISAIAAAAVGLPVGYLVSRFAKPKAAPTGIMPAGRGPRTREVPEEVARWIRSLGPEPADGASRQTHFVSLEPDGYGTQTVRIRMKNEGAEPLKKIGFINSFDTVQLIIDEQGNSLPFRVWEAKDGAHFEYEADLANPVLPQQAVVCFIVNGGRPLATWQGDVWTYNRSHTPIPETEYTETVALPTGASVVSVKPETTRQYEENDRRHLRFERHLARNEAFTCRIEYRLAGEQAEPPHRARFDERWAKDKQRYSSAELSAMEKLYQVANRDFGSEQARSNLLEVIRRWPDANRAGCAAMYLAQTAEGEEQERYLKLAIEKYDDCWYGDGVQVGALARYYLAQYYRELARNAEADKLIAELRRNYAGAVQHSGEPLLTDEDAARVTAHRAPETLPIPWADGERLQYGLRTAAGMPIGTIVWDATLAGKSEADMWWRVESRTAVTVGDAMQYTCVNAGRESFLPMSGLTRNAMGEFKAYYGQDKVKLMTSLGGTDRTQEILVSMPVYDNEQALYQIRRLPLEKGGSHEFEIFPVQGGAPAKCRIEVVGQESVTVAAGTFDCFKVLLSVYSGPAKALEHSVWFSRDAHRYPVKYDAGATVMTLSEIGRVRGSGAEEFRDEEMGLSLRLPAGWIAYRNPSPGAYKMDLRLLPALRKSLMWASFLAAGRTPDVTSARAVAERDIAVVAGYFKGYTVRPGSWSEREIGGLPAAAYVADYEENGTARVEYRTYLVGKSLVYWFVFRMARDDFQQVECDSIVNSLRVAQEKVQPAAGSALPNRLEAERLCAQGWQLWRAGNFAEAEKLFDQSVKADPANAEAWNGLGWSRMNLGMSLNAKEAFRKCLAVNAKHAAALNGLGWIAKNEGQTEEAVRYWERAVEAAPDATAALAGLAQVRFEAKDFEQAGKYYQMCLDVDPQAEEARIGLKKCRELIAKSRNLRRVRFEQGVNTLRDGDAILLTNVLASSSGFAVGDTVKVQGTYTLSSRPRARLALFCTATRGEGRGPVMPEQIVTVERGTGEFTLSQTIDDFGCLHLTFYEEESGWTPVGGFYFGTRNQVQEMERLTGKGERR